MIFLTIVPDLFVMIIIYFPDLSIVHAIHFFYNENVTVLKVFSFKEI